MTYNSEFIIIIVDFTYFPPQRNLLLLQSQSLKLLIHPAWYLLAFPYVIQVNQYPSDVQGFFRVLVYICCLIKSIPYSHSLPYRKKNWPITALELLANCGYIPSIVGNFGARWRYLSAFQHWQLLMVLMDPVPANALLFRQF